MHAWDACMILMNDINEWFAFMICIDNMQAEYVCIVWMQNVCTAVPHWKLRFENDVIIVPQKTLTETE